jgi:hypothetical protein
MTLLRLASLVIAGLMIAPAWGAGSATDLVEIKINEQRFAIPADYIATVAHHTHGSIKLVRLTVFWPTMEPLANRVPQKLELPGPKDINVLLRKRPGNGYQMLHAAIKLGWIDEQDEAGPFGLRAYIKDHERRRRTTRRYVSAGSEVRTPSGDPIVFDCDDDFSWDAEETMTSSPPARSITSSRQTSVSPTGSIGSTSNRGARSTGRSVSWFSLSRNRSYSTSAVRIGWPAADLGPAVEKISGSCYVPAVPLDH